MSLMTRGIAPGTASSRAHRRGTESSPRRRAATAGNSASRSSVVVKMQLTMSSGLSELRSITVRTSSSVASRIASARFSGTVIAPLRARSRTAGIVSELPSDARGRLRRGGRAQAAVRPRERARAAAQLARAGGGGLVVAGDGENEVVELAVVAELGGGG